MQWIGGLGVIGLSIVLLPAFGMGNTQMFSAEASITRSDRIHPKLTEVAKFMWITYFVLTVVQVLLLMLGGMNFFEALCHSFSTISTGGFSVYNESIGYYESAYVEYVVMIFMFLGGVNFTLYYMLIKRKMDRIASDDEFKSYLYIVIVVSIVLATINYTDDKYWSLENCLRDSFFQVISIMTGSGFYTCDYTLWSSPTLIFIALLLVSGASTGSTSGSIKIMRHIIVFRSIVGELKRAMHPTAVVPVRYNGRGLASDDVRGVMVFVLLYFLIILIGIIIMGLLGYGLDDSFGLVANSLGNVGASIGNYGPSGALCELHLIAKLTMTILMLIGRLEIYTVILLFTRGFWKR
jgi:trk system potassium uptake protein TrkH